MAQELIIGFAIAALRILASLALSAGALYTGISFFDRMTAGIEEWKEMKKGNAAIGILLVSVMVGMLLLMEQRIGELVFSIQIPTTEIPLQAVLLIIAFTVLNYLLGLLASVLIIFLTINLVDRITPNLDEFSELKKGNIAVGLVLSAALLLVIFAARPSIESAFTALLSLESTFI
ncbi:MAG: DUF350 domain-containing protein [Candidatus Micrarchaeota archaeon]